MSQSPSNTPHESRWTPTPEAREVILRIVKDSKYGLPMASLAKVAHTNAIQYLADDAPSYQAVYHRIYKLVPQLLEEGLLRKDAGGLLHYADATQGPVREQMFKGKFRRFLSTLIDPADKHLAEDLGYLRAAFTGAVEEIESGSTIQTSELKEAPPALEAALKKRKRKA